MSDKPVFVVKRSEWFRGNGTMGSYLRTTNGMQCCLGFVGQQCGVPENQLLFTGLPYGLSATDYDLYPKLPTIRVWNEFATINDDRTMSEEHREQRLQELARECGFEFRFED